MKKIVECAVDLSGIKRCYIEGVLVKIDCPTCGEKMVYDSSGDYLSYPETGKPESVYIVCDHCLDNDLPGEYEFDVVVVSAVVTLKYDDPPILYPS